MNLTHIVVRVCTTIIRTMSPPSKAGMLNSQHAVLCDVLCGPTHFSNYTRCAAQNVPVLIAFKFQMHVK
jgi:hypothetical protein